MKKLVVHTGTGIRTGISVSVFPFGKYLIWMSYEKKPFGKFNKD